MATKSRKSDPNSISTRSREMVKLQDARIEVERRGKGAPLLLLQSEEAYESDLGLVDELAKRHEVIIPWAPGYGKSTLPDSLAGIDDVSYLYLDLLDRLNLTGVKVMGFSVGGWIAAEIATKNCGRLDRLVLVDTVGAKFGGPFDRDIEDIYYLPTEEVRRLKFHDGARDPLADMSTLSRKRATAVARHRETTAKFCWEPYFHNPSLKNRLGRIQIETLVVWGAKDGFVRPKYGRAFTRRIPGAQFVAIPKAGHYPHIEQGEIFLETVEEFLK